MSEEITIRFDDWNEGLVACEKCDTCIEIEGNGLLTLDCPECGAEVFVPLKVSDYWLYHFLGGGGMGHVYLAVKEDEPDVKYAVKVIPRGVEPEQYLIDNLMHEGEVGDALGDEHNHVVPVYEFGNDGDEYYTVSEYVEGVRLDKYIAENGVLSEERSIEIILQILDAELHIYESGYLFRDMKPENVIIDKDGNVQVFDYGLCLHVSKIHSMAKSSNLEGSPFYLPPERIVGAPEGEYSEIYSVGMIWFFLLMGRTYYSSAEIKDLMKKHVNSTRIATVGNHLKHCHPRTIEILDKMIARTPSQRAHSFVELLDEIEELLEIVREQHKHKPEFAKEGGRKKKNILFILIPVLLALGVGMLWMAHTRAVEREKKIKEYKESIAKVLHISPDIPAPKLSKEAIEKKIDELTAKEYAVAVKNLPKFDEEAEKKKIYERYKFTTSIHPSKTISQIKNMMQQRKEFKIKKMINEQIKPFDREMTAQAIAKSLGQSYPIKPPTVSLQELEKKFMKAAKKKVHKKFPKSMLLKKISEIIKDNAAYMEGDEVTITDALGNIVKGKYKGREGNKLVIGDRKILVNDLPRKVIERFSEGICQKRINRLQEYAREKFSSLRKNYLKKLTSIENKRKEYQQYGYTYVNNHWISYYDLAKQKLALRERNHATEMQYKKRKIKHDIMREFSKLTLKEFKKEGYYLKNGRWVAQSEEIEKILKEHKKRFAFRYQQKKRELRESIRSRIEKKLYTENHYIKVDGEWVSGKEALDKRLEQIIKSGKL